VDRIRSRRGTPFLWVVCVAVLFSFALLACGESEPSGITGDWSMVLFRVPNASGQQEIREAIRIDRDRGGYTVAVLDEVGRPLANARYSATWHDGVLSWHNPIQPDVRYEVRLASHGHLEGTLVREKDGKAISWFDFKRLSGARVYTNWHYGFSVTGPQGFTLARTTLPGDYEASIGWTLQSPSGSGQLVRFNVAVHKLDRPLPAKDLLPALRGELHRLRHPSRKGLARDRQAQYVLRSSAVVRRPAGLCVVWEGAYELRGNKLRARTYLFASRVRAYDIALVADQRDFASQARAFEDFVRSFRML
jgi:hypothetical protein